jgi:hypothetical protein
MNIQVTDTNIASEVFTVDELVKAAPFQIQLSERVPAVQGDAVELRAWYEAWKKKHGKEHLAEPTHFKVEAVDEFQALIPWGELSTALFLYAQEGKPLHKGGPIRLYVPSGSSDCLNVKSVVKFWFLHDASLGNEAVYGFKNAMTADELKLKK